MLTLKLPFRIGVTYVLGCSFIKSSLLRSVFVVCYQLNNIKQHAWWIKRYINFKERKGFKVKEETYFQSSWTSVMELFFEKSTNDFRKKSCTIYVRLGKYTFEKVGVFKMKLSRDGSRDFEKGWRCMSATTVGRRRNF